MVQEGATRQLLDLLKDGTIDAVIGTPTNDPEFNSAPLFEEALWVCAASDDPLSLRTGPVTLSDLADSPLLSLSAGFSLHDLVEQLARKAGTYLSRDYEGESGRGAPDGSYGRGCRNSALSLCSGRSRARSGV